MNDQYAIELLKERLAKTKRELLAHSLQLDIPLAPTSQVDLVTNSDIPASLKRLCLFLFDNPAARSDTISAACSIGNISDAHTPPTRLASLQKLGLKIECKTMKACNKFGDSVVMGYLFISPTSDNPRWEKRTAANDAVHAHVDK
jgi:hypothetical protein